ncbi:efflux RND transporter periplasmic adaptor subunit [Mucilaginibacter sp. HMF5004]|uniref:efflux RND transporter periplasmic adaptor subunit n=1 Tax=Mucilaginibacter rivuli TaxID=2857527 RepID=UPI001C5DB34E|nr:efflux RND transporter periplasmic adaptor subunit [Mucilaginibacter rivuli]MBW4889263.1 efflux RND transporter periplasmic adaptor subunit [Mucilaginibacter rivuli]
MNRKYLLISGTLALLAWTACKQPVKTNAALPPTPVNIDTAEKMNAVYYDQFPGIVVPLNNVELRSQVTGFITGITFKEGDIVQQGKVLYEIDRRKYEAAYQQAQAALQNAQAGLVRSQKDADRYNQLLKQDAVARQLVDNAEATLATSQSQVASAKAGVASAKTDLDFSVIRAPFTGRIGISQVRLGSQVTAGTTLLNTISSEDPIAVDFVVDENSIPRFSGMIGKTVADSTFQLLFVGKTPYTHNGKIIVVDRGVDNQSGTIKVRVQFPNPKKELISGMSCTLKVLNKESGNNVVVPYKSIVEQMGEFFVFISQDTIAKQQRVKVGPRVNDKIVILDGVNEGDKIITEGLGRLRDGGKIMVGMPKKQGTGAVPAK